MTTLPCVMLSISVEALFLDLREELATPIPYAPREGGKKEPLREELAAPIPLLPQGSLQNI